MSRELVVLSHLRWAFVWQRPQHLISRMSRGFDATWFVEEPITGTGPEPVIHTEEHGNVVRVVLELPPGTPLDGFDATACELYSALLPAMLSSRAERTVWLYTPMALDIAFTLAPSRLVYDVMD